MKFDYKRLALMLGIDGRVSGDELYAHCPLHNDSHPSFSLNVRKGVWKCFRPDCIGYGGGDFGLIVQLVLGLSPTEAERWIAAGGWPSYEHVAEMFARLLNSKLDDQLEADFQYYNSLPNDIMPASFLQRVPWAYIERWRIRYDPLRAEVVIPVFMDEGFKGFVARVLFPGPFTPKYRNSKSLKKSQVLFGWNEAARNAPMLIVVEGPLDTIALDMVGYVSVATLGGGLSSHQAALLQQAKGEIVLAFDNDEAGRLATENAIKVFPNAKVVVWDGKDPEESNIERCVHQRVSATKYVLERMKNGWDQRNRKAE